MNESQNHNSHVQVFGNQDQDDYVEDINKDMGLENNNDTSVVNCLTTSSQRDYIACAGFPDEENKIMFYSINWKDNTFH